MELQTLYDEERSIDKQADWTEDKTAVDVFYLRVRLFKGIGFARNGITTEQHPVYLLMQDYKSFEGDPELPGNRLGNKHQKKRAYVQGPDSKLIRQAIAIADAFGGKRSYNSR